MKHYYLFFWCTLFGYGFRDMVIIDDCVVCNDAVIEEECFIVNDSSVSLKRDSLYMIVDDYIQMVSNGSSELDGSVVVDGCLERGIDIIFVLSQGELESHFGRDGIASKTNSVFNVGSYDGLGVENIDGKFKYVNMNYSVAPYLDLLWRDYLCSGSKSVGDLMVEYVNKHGQRYASNKNYERDLRCIYNKISRNTDIGRLQSEIENWV